MDGKTQGRSIYRASIASRGKKIVDNCIVCRGHCVVVNFDLGERFPRPRSQQRGTSMRPRARRVAVLEVGAGEGRPLPLTGSGGINPGYFWGHFRCQIPRLGAIWARK